MNNQKITNALISVFAGQILGLGIVFTIFGIRENKNPLIGFGVLAVLLGATLFVLVLRRITKQSYEDNEQLLASTLLADATRTIEDLTPEERTTAVDGMGRGDHCRP